MRLRSPRARERARRSAALVLGAIEQTPGDVAQHHCRVALEPAQLGALHRRPAECTAKVLIRHREDFMRERMCTFPVDDLAGAETLFTHGQRELVVPRANLLAYVA